MISMKFFFNQTPKHHATCNMQHATMTFYLSFLNRIEEKRQKFKNQLLSILPHMEGTHYYTRANTIIGIITRLCSFSLKNIEAIPLWSIIFRSNRRNFLGFSSSNSSSRAISHRMSILTTTKATSCTGQTFLKVFLPTSSTKVGLTPWELLTPSILTLGPLDPSWFGALLLNLGWFCSSDLTLYKFLEILLSLESSIDCAYIITLEKLMPPWIIIV